MSERIELRGTRTLWGRQGENAAAVLCVSVQELMEEWPDGGPAAAFKREDETAYAHELVYDEDAGEVQVTLTSVDTAVPGVARLELSWIDDGMIKKTRIYEGEIKESINDLGEMPDPEYDGLIEQLGDAAARAEAARTQARAAKVAAELAAGEAETFKDAAETAKEDAEAAKRSARDAEEFAISAANEANAARQQAVLAKNGAVNAADEAEAAKTAAASSAAAAEQSKQQAQEIADSIPDVREDIEALQTGKQDKLTAGRNITIQGNVISAASGGDVTAAAIRSALGYTPADDEDVTQVKDDYLAQQRSIDALDMNKLTSPSTGLAVGKYFKIAAIDEDGRAVLEAVDFPKADGNGNYGTVAIRSTDPENGIRIGGNGSLALNPASTKRLDTKTGNLAITPQNLDYAIRAGLLSNSQITDADKPQICQTIGAERDTDWELI